MYPFTIPLHCTALHEKILESVILCDILLPNGYLITTSEFDLHFDFQKRTTSHWRKKTVKFWKVKVNFGNSLNVSC